MLSTEMRGELCDIVRAALLAAVKGESFQPEKCTGLEQKCGCFVTFKTQENLRGCIGCFVSEEPLYLTVSKYARAAVLDDPRFTNNRIQENELPEVHFDISVLSPLEKCSDPENIELGKHGIYIVNGFQSGCFLPQVATETGWSVEEFWGYCCEHKAGLPFDSWRQPGADIYTFTAEVIEAAYQPT